MAPSSQMLPGAQDPDELFDIVDADGRQIGIQRRRADVHRDGDWHRALHVWIYGLRDGNPFLTFQRRGMSKDTAPGRLDPTVGGHFGAGETRDDVWREVEEELDIPADPASMRFAGTRVRSSENEPEIVDREIQDVYLWRRDAALESYTPNPVELAGLVEVPIVPLVKVFACDGGTVPAIMLDAASGILANIELESTEFVSSVDRYPYRVAVAALAALRGDEWISV